MDDGEFARLLEQKYAQIVLKVLLDADGHSCAFSTLRDEVNAIVTDDSRGAEEIVTDGEYSSASLSSVLSAAKGAGIVEQYLNENGQKRWRIRPSELSQSQIDEIRSRTHSGTQHMDTPSHDNYGGGHTDSEF
jgi:hypothetical protein